MHYKFKFKKHILKTKLGHPTFPCWCYLLGWHLLKPFPGLWLQVRLSHSSLCSSCKTPDSSVLSCPCLKLWSSSPTAERSNRRSHMFFKHNSYGSHDGKLTRTYCISATLNHDTSTSVLHRPGHEGPNALYLWMIFWTRQISKSYKIWQHPLAGSKADSVWLWRSGWLVCYSHFNSQELIGQMFREFREDRAHSQGWLIIWRDLNYFRCRWMWGCPLFISKKDFLLN